MRTPLVGVRMCSRTGESAALPAKILTSRRMRPIVCAGPFATSSLRDGWAIVFDD
jgi:hypothetical protein